MLRLPNLLLLAAFALTTSTSALAADKATTERLRELETEIGTVDQDVSALRVNFTERSGLIGVGEARERYEDAVYAYLVGDFASAATSFYILVQSRALGNADLARDSEWYLAECLFELGNFRTSEEAYRFIMEKGPTHPYFSDSVRRILEVYGILGDDEHFNEVYNLWIVSGKVPATDLVNYTLAKSFFRRGEKARAKAMFDALPTTSAYYTRARYFLGSLMIEEQNLPQAIGEFGKIEASPVTIADQKTVHDLAIMALARLHYEVGDFAKSSAYYGQIDKNSPQFADQLYESVWTFIKQDKWADALHQVDVFLLAYPEHRHTAILKILQGHLNMKLRAYDNARASYERVVEEYTPIAVRLDEVSQTSVESQRFLQRMGDTGNTSGLPQFAVDMLLEREDVGRATQSYLSMEQEAKGLADAERMCGELETALSGKSDALSTFVNAKTELGTSRGAILAMNSRLLEAETAYLKSRVPAPIKAEVAALAVERGKLETQVSDIAGTASISSDKLQIYDEQVRDVQQGAFRLSQQALEQIASARSTMEVLAAGQSKLPADQREDVRKQIDAERAILAGAVVELDRIQSEVERRRIMRSVEVGGVEDNGEARNALLTRYAELRKRTGAFRRYAVDSDAAATFAQIDRLWGQVEALESSSNEAIHIVAAGEARELGAVRQRLASTSQHVIELRRDIDSQRANTETLAVRVLNSGLRDLKDNFSNDVLNADKGIVDVYWLRKTGTTDEMETLTAEQAHLLQELDEKFRVIQEDVNE